MPLSDRPDRAFDLRPVSNATLSDLDLTFFERDYLPAAVAPEVLEANQRSLEHQLMSLRFLTPEGVPTVSGILVAGKDPRWFFPGAYMQFLQIAGTTIVDPIVDQKVISGTLSGQSRLIDEALWARITTSADFAGRPAEVRVSNYPLGALQQLVRNALMHRDYESGHAPIRVHWFSDRIEIVSPGGTYGRVTPANLGDWITTDYRNPHLAEAMRVLQLVQRFGAGIALARDLLERNGNPPLELKATDALVIATVRSRRA